MQELLTFVGQQRCPVFTFYVLRFCCRFCLTREASRPIKFAAHFSHDFTPNISPVHPPRRFAAPDGYAFGSWQFRLWSSRGLPEAGAESRQFQPHWGGVLAVLDLTWISDLLGTLPAVRRAGFFFFRTNRHALRQGESHRHGRLGTSALAARRR